jgi:nitrite reductase/ring-hydroxylating ferredoxin subunit
MLNKQMPATEKYENMPTGPVDIDDALASPAYFEAEREGIFKKVWLNLARGSDIPNPGDYVVKTIKTLETSIILVRNKEGQINAFHNACAHRGMTLCGKDDTSGNKKFFACPFHDWVYDTDGVLKAVPDRQFFAEEDLEGVTLSKINVGLWEGFIFINLDANPAQTLEEFLGETYKGYEGYFNDDKLKLVNRYVMETEMNWKFYVDSSIEAYHANVVHIQNNTGQNNESGTVLQVDADAIRLYDQHRIIGIPSGFGDRELSPVEGLSYQYGSVTPYDPRSAGADMPSGINCNNDPNWAFDIVEFFPNIVLFVSAPLYAVIRLWPSSENKCLYEADVYMSEPENAAARVALEYGLLSLRDVLREDINTAEGTTTMTRSGAVKEYIFSDQEIAVRHNYKVVDDMVQAWLKSKMNKGA